MRLVVQGSRLKVSNARDRVHFSSIIRHSWHSLAEGSPARMRVIMDQVFGLIFTTSLHTLYLDSNFMIDQYTVYVSGSDYVATNYSGNDVRFELLPAF